MAEGSFKRGLEASLVGLFIPYIGLETDLRDIIMRTLRLSLEHADNIPDFQESLLVLIIKFGFFLGFNTILTLIEEGERFLKGWILGLIFGLFIFQTGHSGNITTIDLMVNICVPLFLLFKSK